MHAFKYTSNINSTFHVTSTNSPPGGLFSLENFSKASQFPTVAKAHVLSQYHLLSGTCAETGLLEGLKYNIN